MTTFWLKFKLKSDATFGRGDGVAGMIDAEVQHDEYGLPYIGGRALKGVLEEECANILFALEKQKKDDAFRQSAQHLFGSPGSTGSDRAILHFGDAGLPQEIKRAVASEVQREKLKKEEVLNSLTAIRRYTAVDETTGAPKKGFLRSMRVILRETPFEALLSFTRAPAGMELPLLAACVMAVRCAGTGRNRGRGALTARLFDENGEDVTDRHFELFRAEVMK